MFMPYTATNAQADLKVQPIDAKFDSEVGCPVSLDESEAEMEFDPFNAPVGLRLYLTYRNNSAKSLEAVKFRVQFLDDEGQVCGSFQANDERSVVGGGAGKQKWRKEGINPRTKKLAIRVLQTKFADTSNWTSERIGDYSGVTTGSSGLTPPSATPSTIVPPPAETTQPGSLEANPADQDLKPRQDDPFAK